MVLTLSQQGEGIRLALGMLGAMAFVKIQWIVVCTFNLFACYTSITISEIILYVSHKRLDGLFTVTLGRRSTRVSCFFPTFIAIFLELQKKCLLCSSPSPQFQHLSKRHAGTCLTGHTKKCLWGSWAQGLCVPISLIVGNSLHSASITSPEFQ